MGSRIALFAVAIQLVLSFGHLHPEDIYGNARAFAASSTGLTLPAAGDPRPLPAAPQSNHPDDYCAICAAIHLLGSSFTPEAPQLTLPFASAVVEHFAAIASPFIASRRAPFQSRAPPQA